MLEPAPAPAPPIPKPGGDERTVKSARLKAVQWGWGFPALLAGAAVCVWNIRFALSLFRGEEAAGVAVAALAFSAAVISGKLVILYLAERRAELVEPVRLMWRGAIAFAVVGAGASIWLSHPPFMPQSIAEMQRELHYLANSSVSPQGSRYDPRYSIVKQARARAERFSELQIAIDAERRNPGRPLSPEALAAQQAVSVMGAMGVYALLLLFAAYGLATAIETSVALTEPKPLAPPVQILEPMPIGAPALLGRAERPLFQRASEVIEEPLRWLWPDVIEEGELAVLGGAPGAGKSTIITDIAAVTSTGRRWPDGSPGKLGSCILFELEDRRERVTKPRLIAARANMDHIVFGERIDLSRDVGQLEAQVRAMAAYGMPPLRLVTISPMIRFFGDKVVTNRNLVRSMIEPLTEWAQSRDVAVVGVTHLVPGGRSDEYVGSKAFHETARASWSAIVNDADPEPEEKKKQRILYPAKVSHAPEEERYYRLETVHMPGGLKAARVNWETESAGQWSPSTGGRASRKRANGVMH